MAQRVKVEATTQTPEQAIKGTIIHHSVEVNGDNATVASPNQVYIRDFTLPDGLELVGTNTPELTCTQTGQNVTCANYYDQPNTGTRIYTIYVDTTDSSCSAVYSLQICVDVRNNLDTVQNDNCGSTNYTTVFCPSNTVETISTATGSTQVTLSDDLTFSLSEQNITDIMDVSSLLFIVFLVFSIVFCSLVYATYRITRFVYNLFRYGIK